MAKRVVLDTFVRWDNKHHLYWSTNGKWVLNGHRLALQPVLVSWEMETCTYSSPTLILVWVTGERRVPALVATNGSHWLN